MTQRYVTIEAKQASTGEYNRSKCWIREPKDAGNNRPGVVFMHGAGYGTCDNSFGDMATDLSSAGFVTAVLDKPVWSTNDATRDYPGSAAIYDQVITMLRDLDNVDASNVGIYATSESTWISSYLLDQDPDVAFQVLLSQWCIRHDIRWDSLPHRISRWSERMMDTSPLCAARSTSMRNCSA